MITAVFDNFPVQATPVFSNFTSLVQAVVCVLSKSLVRKASQLFFLNHNNVYVFRFSALY